MTVHFRRRRLSRLDELGALSVSVLVGLGSAAAAYYVTRLLLSRERLGPDPSAERPGLSSPERPRLASPGRSSLPSADGTSDPED